MTETSPWALIDESRVVLSVQIASREWIDANPADPPQAWRESPGIDSPGYAGIGFTWDEPTGWFIPLSPGPEYIFDRERWEWVDPNPPDPPEDTPTE